MIKNNEKLYLLSSDDLDQIDMLMGTLNEAISDLFKFKTIRHPEVNGWFGEHPSPAKEELQSEADRLHKQTINTF